MTFRQLEDVDPDSYKPHVVVVYDGVQFYVKWEQSVPRTTVRGLVSASAFMQSGGRAPSKAEREAVFSAMLVEVDGEQGGIVKLDDGAWFVNPDDEHAVMAYQWTVPKFTYLIEREKFSEGNNTHTPPPPLLSLCLPSTNGFL